MSKKSLIIVAVVACLVCSTASFFIGLSVPRSEQGNPSDGETSKQEDADAKYIGLYIADYYNNGTQMTEKIYLNADHDCKSPDAKQDTACQWSIENNRLLVTNHGGGGYLGKTQEDCDKWLKESNESLHDYGTSDDVTGYEIIKITDQSKVAKGHYCMVSPITTKKYDILSDGSLSGYNHTFYKR